MNSIVEDLLDRAGKQLSDDIDRQVLTSLGLGYVFDFYLEYGKGKIYGQEYLTVAPMNAEGRWSDMMEWMVNSFGPTAADKSGVRTPNQRWYVNNAKFWFRDAKDRDWFVLRWS
jgi:hypothetical protein